MNFMKKLTLTAILLGIFALSGCTGFGPHTVTRDRFDYTGAIGDSLKEQMLVNTVKLRYGDTPVFLDIASVISQYSVESQVDLRLSWVNPVTSAATNTQSTGGAVRYIDRPTITYAPLSDEKFARSLSLQVGANIRIMKSRGSDEPYDGIMEWWRESASQLAPLLDSPQSQRVIL